MCSVLNAYYRVKLEQNDDVTWNVIPVLITSCVPIHFLTRYTRQVTKPSANSIVEINVGIIVGCMPILSSQLRTLFSSLSSLHSRSVEYIRSRLLRSRKQSSNASDGSDHMQMSPPPNDIFLESQLLGSMQGKGTFLQSAEFPQCDWLMRSAMSAQGMPTTREESAHD